MVFPIPPDISYGLQCSAETLDISEDVITFYYRFNEEVDLASLVDNDITKDNLGSIRESLRRTARRLYYRPYNDWFYTKADNNQRAWCISRAANTFGRQAGEFVDYQLSRYISDTLANDLDPRARRYQEDWLDHSRDFTHCEKVAAQLANKSRACKIDDIMTAILSPHDFEDRFPVEPPTIFEIVDDHVRIREIKSGIIIDHKAKKKARRKVLRRSADFLSRLVGEHNTRLFIGGDSIEVTGRRFIFSVKAKYIHATDHGALDIRVLERQTGDYLCNLCWYVDKTPAVDQISAMILAVQSDDEDTIIKIGNAFSVQHDTLAKHSHVHDVIPPSNFVVRDISTDFLTMGTTGNTSAIPDLDDQDDRMLHLTKGTHAMIRNSPDLYQDFARRCQERLLRNRFPEPLLPYYTPHSPEMIRPIFDGRVGRDLLPDVPVIVAARQLLAIAHE